jgi:DNA replication protein DnaC
MRSNHAVAVDPEEPAPVIRQATCEEHGAYEQKVVSVMGREFKGQCPECARIRTAEAAERDHAKESFKRQILMEQKLGAAMIPKRFTGKTFDGYVASTPQQVRALARCKEYADNFQAHFDAGRCMLLLGKPGTGKTHLSVAIANYLNANTRATAVYRTVGAVLQSIRATYDRSSDQSESQVFASLIGPSLLILDEIGASKEKPSDFELSTLFAIINGRYEQLRPTIIVSNLKAEELPGAMGDRCVDRLREGGGIAMAFDWESQRGKEGF